jgi:hypothetical protein
VDRRDKPDKPPAKINKPEPNDKTYAFELRDKSWASVLQWYSDITGLPYVGTYKPKGTVNFMPPKGKRQYTLTEITDLLNELLLAQKYILIRRDHSFTLLAADEKIDPSLLPRVRPDDLTRRAKTELVTVLLPLARLNAEDIGPEVKKMLGPFGDVVVLKKANRLLLLDTAGNLRLVVRTIQEIEAQQPAKKGN